MNFQEQKKLEKIVLSTLNQTLKKNDILVMGLSGGPDSIFLLHHLAKLPNRIICAHLNHQLRKEADQEEKFARKIVEKLNNTKITFTSKSVNINLLSKKSKKGIEETARKERYKFFKDIIKKHSANYLLLGHHADDNLETILHNFTRGCTLQGLIGMKKTTSLASQSNNKSYNISRKKTYIFRPLLNITKEQITSFLKAKKIISMTDKSNFNTKYKRNFIRHKLIPLLKELNPNLIQNTARNAKSSKEILDFLKEKAKTWLKRNTSITTRPETPLSTTIPANNFRQLHPALKKQILKEIYARHYPLENLENIHFQEVLQLIDNNIGNKKKKFGKLEVSILKKLIHFN